MDRLRRMAHSRLNRRCWLDVVRVAAMQAKIAVNYLLKGYQAEMPNTVMTANDPMEMIGGAGNAMPFTTEWFHVMSLPDCLVCGTPGNLTVDLSEVLDKS